MRSGYEEIDTEVPNFIVQKGLRELTDISGKRIGTCDTTGRSPIRAELLDEKIIKVYCGAVHTCLKCPFSSVFLDQTDFKKHSA